MLFKNLLYHKTAGLSMLLSEFYIQNKYYHIYIIDIYL